MNAQTQRQRVHEYLLINIRLTTLKARNELFIMGIAARIFELKARGVNIATVMVPASLGGKRMIAEYVLLNEVVGDA